MAKAKAKVTSKIKKKFWFPVLAPKIFGNAKIGEIYMGESSKAVGRVFWHGLKELSGNMRDQNTSLCFKIRKSDSNQLVTDIIGYKMTPTSIKKMVRRHNDRSDDSFIIQTSDNKKVRVKTLILTAHNTKNSVSTRLKHAMIKKITDDTKKINFGNLVDKLISHKLQMEMKRTLTKIYPVKNFTVKFMGLEKEKLHKEEEVLEETPVVEEKQEEKIEKATEEAEEKAAEKTIEKLSNESEKGLEKSKTSQRVVEKEIPKEKAEAAAEELVEEKKE